MQTRIRNRCADCRCSIHHAAERCRPCRSKLAKIWRCVVCDVVVGREVKRCPPCNSLFRSIQAKYRRTPETRRKMSLAQKGKKHHWKSGSCHPEVAAKIRRAMRSPKNREAARVRGQRFASDPAWVKKIAESVSGAKNPMWQDGRSQIPYAPGWGRKWKKQAWDRAKNLCELCQAPGRDTHHKDFRKDNHALDNLQVLCRRCHKRLHAEHLRTNKSRQR